MVKGEIAKWPYSQQNGFQTGNGYREHILLLWKIDDKGEGDIKKTGLWGRSEGEYKGSVDQNIQIQLDQYERQLVHEQKLINGERSNHTTYSF